ncbi:MAG: alpha/beta fold hydrolase [Gammaproteobacteria bacterium]
MHDQSGLNFILLRGLTRESAHWGDFAMRLRSAFPGAGIHPLDLPGAGPYFREISPDTVSGIAERVRAQAVEQGMVERPAVLVAVSLGGMVAWEWLKEYPDPIGGAVLINISLGGLSPFYRRLRWQCYGKLISAVLTRRIEDREPKLLELLSNRSDGYRQLADDWIEIQRQRPVSAKNALRQIWAAATYRPGDRKPAQPILLLNSLADKLVAPCCSEKVQKKWNLELRTHPWGGHDLTLDDGDWVVNEIGAWLGRSSISRMP